MTEREIEWPTLSFFGFLFIVVGAAVNTGLIATLAHGLEWTIKTGGGAMGLSPTGTLVFAALLVCWVSGVLSALIDNIPFVAVAIPIIAGLLPPSCGSRRSRSRPAASRTRSRRRTLPSIWIQRQVNHSSLILESLNR